MIFLWFYFLRKDNFCLAEEYDISLFPYYHTQSPSQTENFEINMEMRQVLPLIKKRSERHQVR